MGTSDGMMLSTSTEYYDGGPSATEVITTTSTPPPGSTDQPLVVVDSPYPYVISYTDVVASTPTTITIHPNSTDPTGTLVIETPVSFTTIT